MTPSLTPPKLAHTSRVGQLSAASVAGLSIPQGMRQGGGTRGTIRSAAHFPSKAALELGRKIRFARRRIGDRVSNRNLNRKVLSRGSVLDVESPVVSKFIEPCRKASEQAPVVICRKLALPDRSVKADSHLRSSSALRLSQDEDDRDRGAPRCLFQTIRMSEREGT